MNGHCGPFIFSKSSVHLLCLGLELVFAKSLEVVQQAESYDCKADNISHETLVNQQQCSCKAQNTYHGRHFLVERIAFHCGGQTNTSDHTGDEGTDDIDHRALHQQCRIVNEHKGHQERCNTQLAGLNAGLEHIRTRDLSACVGSHMKLLLVERDQYLLERMLEAGKLDMIFTMIPYENPNIEIIPLVEDELLIALPKSHPVSRRCVEEYPDMLDAEGKQRYFPLIDLAECKDVRYVLSGRDRLKVAQLSALRSAFEPEIGFETDTLASAVALSAYEPHGTIVPKLFSTLYDGSDRPYFFHCNGKMPIWSFTLSLQKNFRLSEPEFQYIKLFIHYIDSLGLLTNTHTVDELLDFLRKGPHTSSPSRFS